MTSGETPDVPAEPQDPKRGDEAYDLAEPEDLEREWTADVAEHCQVRSDDGATVTLIGHCLRCGHQMSVELPIKARTGITITSQGPVKADAPLKKPFTKVAICNCGAAHHGRPNDCPSGCGAFGALVVGGSQTQPDPVHVPARGAPDKPCERYVQVIGKPNEAAIHDVAWERKAETEAGQMLAHARSAAEKWTQTVASLTGVFSIVLLVKGPEDLSKAGGTVNVPDVPPTWSAVLTAVLVVLAGIAKATKDYPPWMRWRLLLVAAVVSILVLVGEWADDTWNHRTLIIVLLAAAVAVAATAIITGGLAAFGLPSKHTAASGQILRHRHAKQARTTRSLLRASLYAGTVTLVLVGAAIVLTWIHTPRL